MTDVQQAVPVAQIDRYSIYTIEQKSPQFTWPEREAVSDDDIDAALGAGVPGGAKVYAWLPMADGHTVHQTARDVMRAAIAGVDKARHRLTPGVAASASMALMYLQTGFIECPQCGEEVPTKDLDAAYELATVVQPVPTIGGTVRAEPSPEGKSGDGVEALEQGVADRIMHVLKVAANYATAEANGGEFSEQYRADLASMNGDIISDDRRILFAALTPDATQTREAESKPSWRIAGQDSHFGPFVVVDGVPHDQVVLCYYRNQLQPIHLRLPGQAYVADLRRLMDENQCNEVAIIPVRHSERVSLTRAALSAGAAKGEALQRDEVKVAATGSVEGLSNDWWGVECSGCTLPRRDCECN